MNETPNSAPTPGSPTTKKKKKVKPKDEEVATNGIEGSPGKPKKRKSTKKAASTKSLNTDGAGKEGTAAAAGKPKKKKSVTKKAASTKALNADGNGEKKEGASSPGKPKKKKSVTKKAASTKKLHIDDDKEKSTKALNADNGEAEEAAGKPKKRKSTKKIMTEEEKKTDTAPVDGGAGQEEVGGEKPKSPKPKRKSVSKKKLHTAEDNNDDVGGKPSSSKSLEKHSGHKKPKSKRKSKIHKDEDGTTKKKETHADDAPTTKPSSTKKNNKDIGVEAALTPEGKVKVVGSGGGKDGDDDDDLKKDKSLAIATETDDGVSDNGSKKGKEDDDDDDIPPPVPFKALFRFASTNDIIVFVFGCIMSIFAAATLPSIMLVFGDIIDAIAQPVAVKELVQSAVINMTILGIYGFVTFFLAFFAAGSSAARIANSYRVEYLEAVLRQDGTFFDHNEPGSISLMLSDSALDIQSGLADKWASALQGIFQLVFGFGIAFYYGPLLSLVLLACMPLLIGVTTLMVTWGSEDGMFGKEAYNRAASTASETLSHVRTVISLNAEHSMSAKYDKHLDGCERASTRQATRAAVLTGGMFGVIFCMYGLGFWYGAQLIADSTDNAIQDHPAPMNLFNPNDAEWGTNYFVIAGTPDEPGVCADYFEFDADGNIADISEELEVCACGIPWAAADLENPECGCGNGTTNTGFNVLEGCFSGGRTILVFFAIIMGGFGAGQVGPGIKALTDGRIAAAKMLRVIERCPEIDIDNTKDKKRLVAKTSKDAKDAHPVDGEIVFENMHFKYLPKGAAIADGGDGTAPEGEGKLVFGGCNLTMKAGETVALVGESGCGKSTIAKLVQRFYDPTEGRILLDGTDLRDIALSDLRANIGVVSQEPLLFDKSIEENIRYGNMEATDAEVIAAAQAANAHDFISRMPDGYDTRVGRKGGKLSGGQKQRVAIARAILRNPRILILDEATSALDNRSEKIVQRALDQLVADKDSKRTTIVIAHRLSTVRNADKIVVLGSPEGTSTAVTGSVILEQGSHDELMALEKGFYKAMVGAGMKSVRKADGTKELVRDSMMVDSSKFLEVGYSEITETSSVTSMPKSEKTEETEEDEESAWSKMFGKKKTAEEIAKEKEEAEKLKANKARLWQYTRPEMAWIVIGSCGSVVKGSLMPLLSIVFAEMLTVFYDSDTESLREKSLRWSYLFYAIAILSMAAEIAQKAIFEKVGERLSQRLRSDLFRGMLRQDIAWFEDDANAVGVLTARLSTDVKMVRLITGQSVASTLESMSALTTGIIISTIASWEIFLIMLAMVPLLGATEAAQFLALKGSEGSIRETLNKSTDKLNESVQGIREVQAFSLERMIADELENHIDDVVNPASKKAAFLKGMMMGMIQLVQFVVYAFAFWFGGEMIEKGNIEFDDFNTALWAMAFAASGLGQAALFAGDVAKATAAMTSIFETLDHDPDIASEPWEEKGKADMKTSKPTVRAVSDDAIENGQVELSNVNFAYPTRKGAKIFNEIDLRIPAGKVVALVGSSGSGKSTVIQLLERFYDPISYKDDVDDDEVGEPETDDELDVENKPGTTTDGAVVLDGTNIKDSDVRWVRANMSLVGQEPVLFNDTIFNNIALGKPGCTRKEVENAARNANAYDFIMKMDGGFDASVGTAGGKVSGGQKQRIAIARALVGNPKILLLDEATSALDTESEKIVQASLDKLLQEMSGERTTIIIAHRLSTIRDADVICVLENAGDGSKVVEMGTHDELMEKQEKYYSLVQAYES